MASDYDSKDMDPPMEAMEALLDERHAAMLREQALQPSGTPQPTSDAFQKVEDLLKRIRERRQQRHDLREQYRT